MRIRLYPIDRFIQVLQGQRALYAALLVLYQQHHAGIDDWDLVALRPLFSEEQRILHQLALLEQRRISSLSKLAAELNLPANPLPSQTHLLAALRSCSGGDNGHITADKSNRIEALGAEIKTLMSEVSQRRQPVEELLQNALGVLRRNDSDKVSPAVSPGSLAYASSTSAALAKRRQAGILDKKV